MPSWVVPVVTFPAVAGGWRWGPESLQAHVAARLRCCPDDTAERDFFVWQNSLGFLMVSQGLGSREGTHLWEFSHLP
jgi:hypothetical protein